MSNAHGHEGAAPATGEVHDGSWSANIETPASAEWEYVEQCGCGGHVVRVHV